MRAGIGIGKPTLLLFFCVLLGLIAFGPLETVVAELDEPPRDAQGEEVPPSESSSHADGFDADRRREAGWSDEEVLMMDRLRRGVLLSVSWILLVVGLLLVGLALRKTYGWLQAVQEARVPPTRYFNLQVQVRDRNGELGLYTFDYYPVVVAATGSPDLLLPDAPDSPARFRIDYRENRALLLSDSAVIVNGVPRQHKLLKQDDRIIFGPYRLMFKDASIREQAPPIPGKPVFVWQFPVVALLLALSILFRQAGVVREDRMLLAKAAELQMIELGSAPVPDVVAAAEQQIGEPASGVSTGSVPAHAASPEPLTLVQRIRWVFSGPAATVETAVRERRIAESEATEAPLREPKPPAAATAAVSQPAGAVPESTTTVEEPFSPVPERKESRTPKPPRRNSKSAAPNPRDRRPSAVATAVSHSGRPSTPSGSRTAGAGPGPAQAASTSVTEAPAGQPPAVAEALSGQPLPVTEFPVGQQVPARDPVPASEPPAETTAEVPAPRFVDAGLAKREGSTPAGHRVTQQSQMLQASVLGSITPPVIRNNGINPLEGLGFAKAKSAPEIGRVKVRVIPPGRPVKYFKADILFIHAHPDDESIDFGSLMAMASRADQRIVTLLFTDGESGLDLYPQRKVGDIYPARVLKGGALSQVRVVEATRALSVLGSEMYIRWGLANRPYNTKADEVPADEVIRGWGGEDALLRRLIEVLEGFRPTIVVSPDRKSGAYEHFEHEAVGQVVQNALERLRLSGEAYVRAHLVSIDPYQVDRYDGVMNVDARARDDVSGLAYRSIQTLALKEHVTQRDASVVGISRLSRLDEEYYKPLYWDLELSFQEYLEQISR